jgi:hypothetical protein
MHEQLLNSEQLIAFSGHTFIGVKYTNKDGNQGSIVNIVTRLQTAQSSSNTSRGKQIFLPLFNGYWGVLSQRQSCPFTSNLY